MKSNNIPVVKLGIIAVSRDCFPIALSTKRRENIVKAYKGEIFDCPTTVENEADMQKAVKEVREAGCNALVVFLGNFVQRHQRLSLPRSLTVPACLWQPLRATAT